MDHVSTSAVKFMVCYQIKFVVWEGRRRQLIRIITEFLLDELWRKHDGVFFTGNGACDGEDRLELVLEQLVFIIRISFYNCFKLKICWTCNT